MSVVRGIQNLEGARVAILVSRWNELVTKELLEGAVDTCQQHGIADPLVVWVAGAWEIPVVAAKLARGDKADAIIALGCILQGQTPHAALLAGDVGGALMGLQTDTGVPIGWGILTPDDQSQALDRAGLKYGNKGREATQAALDALSVLRQL